MRCAAQAECQVLRSIQRPDDAARAAVLVEELTIPSPEELQRLHIWREQSQAQRHVVDGPRRIERIRQSDRRIGGAGANEHTGAMLLDSDALIVRRTEDDRGSLVGLAPRA